MMTHHWRIHILWTKNGSGKIIFDLSYGYLLIPNGQYFAPVGPIFEFVWLLRFSYKVFFNQLKLFTNRQALFSLFRTIYTWGLCLFLFQLILTLCWTLKHFLGNLGLIWRFLFPKSIEKVKNRYGRVRKEAVCAFDSLI
jgi:hypothetical protein